MCAGGCRGLPAARRRQKYEPGFTLAIFRTQLFSHTCSLCCCSSVSAKVSVPYRHACVTHVLMALPFSLLEIRRSAITPSTALHAFAPACTLRRRLYLSLRLPVSAHCPSWVRETVSLSQFIPLQLDVQLFPREAYVQHLVFSILIFSTCLVNSPFHSSSVSCNSAVGWSQVQDVKGAGLCVWPAPTPRKKTIATETGTEKKHANGARGETEERNGGSQTRLGADISMADLLTPKCKIWVGSWNVRTYCTKR